MQMPPVRRNDRPTVEGSAEMLKEYTQPVAKPIDGDKNVFSVLVERAERKPNEPLVSYKAHGARSRPPNSATRSSHWPRA